MSSNPGEAPKPIPPPEAPQPPAPSFFERALAAPVSTFIFALCIAVFFLAERSGSTNDTATLIRFGANYRGGVWHGEWWRLFTSMFLHIGITHLVWNIWAGFSWTAPFERVLGTGRFLFIYVLSGLAGSALSIIGHDAVSAGASGALFGVMGGIFVIMRERLGSWRALWNAPGQRQQLVMTVLWLAIGPFVGFDSFAHAGGLLAGMGLTSGLFPGRRHRLGFALFAIVAVVVLSLRPIPGLHDGWVDVRALDSAWKARDWSQVVALTESQEAKSRFALFRAEALVGLGRGEEAASLLPASAPGAEDTLWLARLHEQSGHPDRALRAYDAALKDEPASLDLLWAKYELLHRTGDVAAEEKLGDQLAGDHPGTAMALGIMGRRLLREGQREEALESFTRAYEKEPKVWAEDRTMLLITLGQREEARATLEASPAADFLSCYLACVEGDFAGAGKTCEALKGDSLVEREVRALRLVGLDRCDDALKELRDEAGSMGPVLRSICAVRAGGEPVPGLSEASRRVVLFARSKDVKDLEGMEDDVKNSFVWPLLPEDARRALPR